MPIEVIIGVCLILVILTVVLLVKNKIVRVLAGGLHVAFFALLICALITLFVPMVFTNLANYTLESMGTLNSIQQIDKATSVDTYIQPTKDVFNQITDFFNFNKSDSNQNNTNSTDSNQTTTKGLLETNIYPSFVSFFENFYRIVTLIFSIAGMALIIYASYATGNVEQIEHLERRVRALEQLINNK